MAKWKDGDIIRELTEAIVNCKKAFKKYGRHSIYCHKHGKLLSSDNDCTCGFDETLKLMNQRELKIPTKKDKDIGSEDIFD